MEIYIEEEQDLLALHCRVEGLQNAHDIMPIANACIEGCDRGFAQGLGMGGPSGFFKPDDTEHTSHSMLAVGREYGCIAIYARAQHRLHNVSCVKGSRLSVGFDTECIGEDARWLGCIAPFMPAVGFVDMMRISGDISARWEESGYGPDNMLQELFADQYFNNIYWQNDPDAILIRDFHTHLTAPQVEALSLMEAMSGGTVYTSAPIHLISDDRRQLLNFIRPNKLQNAEYPFWSEMREEICVIQRLQKRSLIYFFNETNRTIIKPYDWKALLGDGVKYLRKYHGECVPVEEIPFVTIPPRSGILYFATAEPLEADPANLWEE